MAVENPSFELAGARPGDAAGWRLQAFTQRVRVAAFGAPQVGFESYEWAPAPSELSDLAMQVALFDDVPETVEDYEDGWGGGLFEFSLATADLAIFAGAAAVEDHEWTALLDDIDAEATAQADFVDPDGTTTAEGWEQHIWTTFEPEGYVLDSLDYWGVENRPADALLWIQTYEVDQDKWDTLMTTI